MSGIFERLARFLKSHTLWVAFVAVLAPLLVLLWLQLCWLVSLERTSALAHKATLTNYLGAVGSEVEYFYSSTAERALNIPAALFAQGRLDTVAVSWKSRPVEGVKRLFLVDYTRQRFGNILVYNPARHLLESPPASDEAVAIISACTPWQILSYRGLPVESPAPRVDERNSEYRIILNPVTDESARLVGIAGMILDEDYFRRELLPTTIRKALPEFFPGTARGELAVTVRDARGRVVLGAAAAGRSDDLTIRFPFVFADWTLALKTPGSSPEHWARASFAFNVTLSALLAAALMGGIAMALRAADRAMRLSEMKSDFVSNVSHELRTPLASIRVFAELLRLGRVQRPEKIQEYGEFIEAESRRLSRLIDNILDFSHIESGGRLYNFQPADAAEVVAATLRTFEVHLKARGYRITFEAPERPLPPVAIDADAIGQAVHNLLDNAVKYSGDSKEIVVRLERRGDDLVISVRDHGIGIPRDEHRKIFERFHRVGTGLVHEVKGSGLGLAIVRHIVEAHRGMIRVESEPGRGSTFSIHLPLRPARVEG
ncbi:MAG TPA: ATP-binding protein [Candidatus Polarisedimenticolia bacterium]|nr:ATP-binding protein [Candidatus Polarisedimenticolia bacterium]